MLALLETLALMLLLCPAILGMGLSLESMCDGCDCGCDPNGGCTSCPAADLEGELYDAEVVISGMGDVSCACASAIDGTHILPMNTTPETGAGSPVIFCGTPGSAADCFCQWSEIIATNFCGVGRTWTMRMAIIRRTATGETTVHVYVTTTAGSSCTVEFTGTFSGTIDCEAFTDEVLAWEESETGECDGSSATCTASLIPA